LRIEKHVFAIRERVRATMVLDLRTEPDFIGELSLQATAVTKDGTVVFTVHGSARVDSGD
jgi:hypothetical protein